MPDEELFAWAAQERRRLVTENVKDSRRLAMRSEEAGRPPATLLCTSSRSFPRSRHNPGPLVAALEAWLCRADAVARPVEDWLQAV